MAGGVGRYNDILDTFTRYIAELGYDGVNFSLVAKELGVSKGTIVHHFGTKDRILAALHEAYMTKRLAELEYMIVELDTPSERLAAALHAFMIYHVEDRAATVAFQREVVRLAHEESMAEGARLRARYFTLVQQIVEAGIESGEFRKVDSRIDSFLMFGSAQWAWTWFRPEGSVPIEAVGQALVDLVLGSLLTNRENLAELSDPEGHPARIVREAIRAVSEAEEAVSS
ncbi:TetR/AcrR family transcriptional regulator [Pseudonocardia hispaniensis]|uniref:TetR/AcrR family transcriptional regulator n=1 Tax=Pseudonocardia hispaniensis TaxID=904933 RepID=A0ABW1IWI8_9PSEU